MTFVTPEPCGVRSSLAWVGDTKGLLKSEMRSKTVRWMTLIRIKKVEDGLAKPETLGRKAPA